MTFHRPGKYMLQVYAAEWCPHCQKTVAYLKSHSVPFEYHDIEKESKAVVAKIDEVNGGSWIVPTLEFDGKWRPGKKYDEAELARDLKAMGVIT